MKQRFILCAALLLVVPLLFYGCGSGDTGAAAPTTGTISGTVTDAVKGDPLAGVTVTASSDNAANVVGTATTDAAGHYSLSAPIGGAFVNFSKQFYTQPGSMFVGIGGGQTTTVNAAMSEAASGRPSASFAAVAGDNFGYGATVALAVSANDPNGDNVTYTWSNATSGTPKIGTVTGSGTAGSLTFPTIAQAFQKRADPTDFNDISGYTLEPDFGVVPVFPDIRGAITASVKVDDGRGQSVTVSLTLNAASIQTGTRNVAKGSRVYLNSGHDNNNSWTFAGPAGSTAALDNANVRTPSFIPDLVGQYTVSEGGNTTTIYAGTWVGVIDPLGTQLGNSGNTIPVDVGCLGCHDDTTAPNKFDPWAKTGHATIFRRGIDKSGEGTSGAGCFGCHTVGYDPGSAAGGFDDVASEFGFVFPSPAAGNWDNLLATKPAVAKLANIQCENCHGPNASVAHTRTALENEFASPRISFSAEKCATCHGRTTHNIYSQWATLNSEGRGHSNRQRARSQGRSTDCGRCHSAQGFHVFVEMLEEGNVGPINNIQFSEYSPDNVFTSSVNTANVEPQTCTACHDPHDASNPNQLRVYNDVPKTLAGFQVRNFGKGAVCTLCHSEGRSGQLWNVNPANDNTQTFLHEDAITGGQPPQTFNPPHVSAITDVLVGRNVYFMGSSLPMGSKHLAVEDVCVGCHMRLNAKSRISHGVHVAKTHLFSLEFTEDPTKPETQRATFCANCHGAGGVNGDAIEAAVQEGIDALTAKMSADMLAKLQSFGVNTVQLAVGVQVPGNSITAATFKPNLDTSRPPGTTFEIVSAHGTDNVALANFRLGSDNTVQIFPNSSNMMKAIWNYGIVFAGGGGPKCFHNPSFLLAVLNNTRAADLTLTLP